MSNTSSEMDITEKIAILKSNLSGKGKINNDFIRNGYETDMPSMDFTSFLKTCINDNDIESIYQYLCLLKSWTYNSEASLISGFPQSFVADRLKKYYGGKREVYDAIDYPSDSVQRNKLLHNISNEFKGVSEEYILNVLSPKYMDDKERIKIVLETNFSKYVSISQDCRCEILSVFLYLLPDFDIFRGFYMSFLEDCIAERLSFALSLYDFRIVNMEELVNIANMIIDYKAKDNDYYKEMPKFIGLRDKEYISPATDSLKEKLISYGIAERFFLLHDIFLCGSIEPYYKTKEMGIDENDTLRRFIEDGFVIKNTNPSCLMDLTKDELLNIANEQNISVKKSWSKSKIYTCIIEDENSSDRIYQIISDLNILQINPAYEDDFQKLVDYKEEINDVVKLLFFA